MKTALMPTVGAEDSYNSITNDEPDEGVIVALEEAVEEEQAILDAGEHTGLLSYADGRGSTGYDDEDGEGAEMDAEAKSATVLMAETVSHTKAHEALALDRLNSAEELLKKVKHELADAKSAKQHAMSRMRAFDHKRHCMVARPGPLEWVDSDFFGGLCSTIVALNLSSMLAHSKMSKEKAATMDNLFLMWYIIELALKYAHHRSSLFFGPMAAVRWNWLDLGIVVSGIVDQLVSPLVSGATGTPGTSLASLRLLRCFRFLRILKIAKTFLITDTDWLQESQKFDLFMASIITLNAVVMSFELDWEWSGWVWVDNGFLSIYVFELLLRLKRWGWHFFTSQRDYMWNWLDFIIVSTGMLDLWLMPGIELFKAQILDQDAPDEDSAQAHEFHSVMSLVRLTRLMRVLRLVRVLRSVPPLYTLLVGVIDAFGAMKWVIVLTLLTLYGGAIVFTNLIGKGLIYEDHKAPAEAREVFGTMGQSLFSLFELMNGDTSVIEPIKAKVIGKFLFACFMVVSNWAVLAILTAVVSENMIASSNRFAKEEQDKQELVSMTKSKDRLLELFLNNDPDRNGSITRAEWAEMIASEGTRLELSEGTHLSEGDLLDLFECLTVETTDDADGETVEYREIIHSLKENNNLADKRSVLHVMIRMRAMQDQVQTRMDSKFDDIATVVRRIETHVRGEGASL